MIFKIMEKMKAFEKGLFGDSVFKELIVIYDLDLLVDRIVVFPSLRPLMLERLVDICIEYCKKSKFRHIAQF